MNYKPPFTVTDKTVNLVAEISELIGKIHISERMDTNPHLWRKNRIRTIHSSLAIENNTLSIEQVTAIISGKRVLGLPTEIQEVKNAFAAYESLSEYNPYDINDLLKAHESMMSGLVPQAGQFHTGSVGVFAGNKLIHMAPPAYMVRGQVEDLLAWVRESSAHMLIKSCVFHYEFEYIHPFQDGNGRMGRLWQTLLLSTYKPLFVYLPIETLIKERQQEYYDCLRKADSVADSGIFVEFLLQVIFDALEEAGIEETLPENLKKLMQVISYEPKSAKELMALLGLTRGQTLRDGYLKPAMQKGLIAMTEPEKPNSRNQKYYKK